MSMIHLLKTPEGLRLTPTPELLEDKERLAALPELDALCEIFEKELCNGWELVYGLTSAFVLQSPDGVIYFDYQHAIRSTVDLLLQNKVVTWNALL